MSQRVMFGLMLLLATIMVTSAQAEGQPSTSVSSETKDNVRPEQQQSVRPSQYSSKTDGLPSAEVARAEPHGQAGDKNPNLGEAKSQCAPKPKGVADKNIDCVVDPDKKALCDECKMAYDYKQMACAGGPKENWIYTNTEGALCIKTTIGGGICSDAFDILKPAAGQRAVLPMKIGNVPDAKMPETGEKVAKVFKEGLKRSDLKFQLPRCLIVFSKGNDVHLPYWRAKSYKDSQDPKQQKAYNEKGLHGNVKQVVGKVQWEKVTVCVDMFWKFNNNTNKFVGGECAVKKSFSLKAFRESTKGGYSAWKEPDDNGPYQRKELEMFAAAQI